MDGLVDVEVTVPRKQFFHFQGSEDSYPWSYRKQESHWIEFEVFVLGEDFVNLEIWHLLEYFLVNGDVDVYLEEMMILLQQNKKGESRG